MASITLDELVVIINAQTSDFKRQVAEIDDQLAGLKKTGEQSSKSLIAGFEGVGNFGLKVMKYGIAAGIGAIAASIPGAVRRIDTLVAFPRVLEALGISSDDARKATDKLSDALTGLPTPLQDGAAGVQALVVAGLGIDDATDTYLAFNNAVLAGGIESGRASAAFDMLNKALSRGKFTAQEWDSVATAMPTAMKALQNETGLTSEGLRELYSNDPEQLMKDLQRLNTEGGGSMASLDEQAREATGGIGTAFDNMKNAITRGLQGIVTELGNGDLEAGQKKISDAISALGDAFSKALEKASDFIRFLIDNKDVVIPIAVTVGTFVGIITALYGIIKLVAIVTAIWNGVLLANPIVLVIVLVAALIAGLVYFFRETETGQKIWAAFTDFLKNAWDRITGFFTEAWDAIKAKWNEGVQFYKDLWQGIKDVFNGVTGWFSNKFSEAWNAIKNVWNAVVGFFRGVWNGIVAVFSPVVRFYASIYSTAWNVVKGIWNAAVGFFRGIVSGISGAFSGVANMFKGVFQGAWNRVKGIWDKVADWFGNIDLAGAGRKMIQSLIDGITGMVGKAKEAASNVAGAIRDFFPFSPAKEGPFSGRGYTTYSGKALMQDFAGAIKNQAPFLKKTMDSAIPSLGVPSLNQLESGFGTPNPKLSEIDGRSSHIVVKIGEDTIIDRVVKGINRKSFMGNSVVLEV